MKLRFPKYFYTKQSYTLKKALDINVFDLLFIELGKLFIIKNIFMKKK